MVREHDPLCVAACGCGDCDDYCQCDLIARAKADERKRILGKQMYEINVGDRIIIIPAAVLDVE